MSMKRSRLPQTNTSQGNLNFIQSGMGSGTSRHSKSRIAKDAEEFKQFI